MRIFITALFLAISYAQTGEGGTTVDCESFTLELECRNNGCGWDGEECDILSEITGTGGEGAPASAAGGEGGAAGAPVDCETFILQAQCESNGCGWDGEECDLLSEIQGEGGAAAPAPAAGGEAPEPEAPEAGEGMGGFLIPIFQGGGEIAPGAELPGSIFDNAPAGGMPVIHPAFHPEAELPEFGEGGFGAHPAFHPEAEVPEFGEGGFHPAFPAGGEAPEAAEGGEVVPFDCEEPTLESVCVAHNCCWDAQAGECDDPGEVAGCTAVAGGMGGEAGEGAGEGTGQGGQPAGPAEIVEVEAVDCRLGFTPKSCSNVEGCIWYQDNCYQTGGGQLSTTICDASQMCEQTLMCIGEYQYASQCGPSNCDTPIGKCDAAVEIQNPFKANLRKSMPISGKPSNSVTHETRWFFLGAGSVLLIGALFRAFQHLRKQNQQVEEISLDYSRLTV